MGLTSILVLDDVDAVRSRILQSLCDLNVDIFLEADSAPSAVQAIAQYRPQVAILDIQVPGTDTIRNGMDVLRWAHIHYPETAVIILSNHNHPQYRKTCVLLGAVRFFDKSSEFEYLHDSVKALLEMKAAKST